MRIGFDAKRAFRNFTGLGNYSRSTISILSEFYPDNRYFLYTTFYKKHPLLTFANRPNITVRGPEGMLKRIPAAWRTYGMRTDINFDKVELFHGLTAELPVGISSNTRTVVTIHDLIFLRYPEYYKPVDRWIYTKKYASACQRADLILAISEQTKRELISFFNVDEKKIRLVYQGCDPQFSRACSEVEKKNVKALYKLPDEYVLYVGTIESRKNLQTLVKALHFLPESLKLVVVGSPTAYFNQVQLYIAEHHLEHRVVFLHHAVFNHLPAIYQQAQTFCAPSLFEGFGIPVLEALNSRIPVVSANTSSLPEAGGPDSLYVEPLDEEGFAGAILKTIDDKPLRQQMIDRGTAYAQQFNEEHIAKNIWDVYRELI
ncbi:MAG: glycosyltransferase family 4 protein [Prevotellaceae bacterium]|jgi:glycosyltransferase involved in cell wall biosynthesis|nr:glycosyltransferase family 4 protein [Prevotellaceae bacterium]